MNLHINRKISLIVSNAILVIQVQTDLESIQYQIFGNCTSISCKHESPQKLQHQTGKMQQVRDDRMHAGPQGVAQRHSGRSK